MLNTGCPEFSPSTCRGRAGLGGCDVVMQGSAMSPKRQPAREGRCPRIRFAAACEAIRGRQPVVIARTASVRLRCASSRLLDRPVGPASVGWPAEPAAVTPSRSRRPAATVFRRHASGAVRGLRVHRADCPAAAGARPRGRVHPRFRMSASAHGPGPVLGADGAGRSGVAWPSRRRGHAAGEAADQGAPARRRRPDAAAVGDEVQLPPRSWSGRMRARGMRVRTPVRWRGARPGVRPVNSRARRLTSGLRAPLPPCPRGPSGTPVRS
ncbi:hypothetical protein H180DRAFT_04874 [Streptomyces sp. WMMB 322]|nr:hypothetical protein H180DRAFT_04874 [Streptomyces sp. WMMB 322]